MDGLEKCVQRLVIGNQERNEAQSVCLQPELEEPENAIYASIPSQEELETAAQIILAPPNLVSAEQRKLAEQVFLNFRQASSFSPSPYELCRNLLEFSNNDLVLSEACGVMKNALLRQWSALFTTDPVMLKIYLLNYIINKPDLAPLVRDKIIQIISIIMKKLSSDDSSKDGTDILNYVEFIIDGDLTKQILGYKIILTLIQEYAQPVTSSEIRLTCHVHFKAKQTFETTFLQRTFQFCVQALQKIITADGVPENMLTLIQYLLSICESILFWDYVSGVNSSDKTLVALFKDQNIGCFDSPLRPTEAMKSILLNPEIIELFFNIYWKVHTNWQLGNPAKNCLYKLATLEDALPEDSMTRLNFLTNYLINFLKLLSSIELSDQEVIGIASIFSCLIFSFQFRINELPEDLQKNLIKQFLRITCLFAEKACLEELTYSDECFFVQAFGIMLNAWTFFILNYDAFTLFTKQFFEISSIQIFDTYIQCLLAPPDGIRKNIDETFNETNVIEGVTNHLLNHKQYLLGFGTVSRFILPHLLSLLSRLIEERTEKLKEQLNFAITQSQEVDNLKMNFLQNIYEDLYWLVIISSHLLCNTNILDCLTDPLKMVPKDGVSSSMISTSRLSPPFILKYAKSNEPKDTCIPKEVIAYTTEMASGPMDLNLSLKYLTSPTLNISDIENGEQLIDPVIRLITAILRISDVENVVINSNAQQFLSFKLCYINIWFLQCWSYIYFIPNTFSNVSNTLEEAFNRKTPSAFWIQNFLANKILLNIKTLQADQPVLINETMFLLKVLINSDEKISRLRKMDNFNSFVELGMNSRNLPRDLKRNLMCAITATLTQVDLYDVRITDNVLEKFCERILKPLRARLQEVIVATLTTSTDSALETLCIETIDILESFIGVIQGVKEAACSHGIIQYIYEFLKELPNVLTHLRDYPDAIELILETFHKSLRNAIFSYDSFDTYYKIIRAYTDWNQDRIINADSTEDEFNDILLIMKIISRVCRNKIEFSESLENDFIFTDIYSPILSTIIPSMANGLIKYPELCAQFFDTIRSISDNFEEKLFRWPEHMLKQLFFCIEYGLSSIEAWIRNICYNIIFTMSKIFCLDIIKTQPENQLMAPFLELLFKKGMTEDLILYDSSKVAYAVYFLICCYPEKYQQLMERLININGNDPSIAEALRKAFDKLNHNMQYDANTAGNKIFSVNFHNYILEIRRYQNWIQS